MRVLVIGSGGREHALAWALARSPRVEALLIAPGNAGTAACGENVPIAADDLDGLLRLVEARRVDLTVVGPEGPLSSGIVDRFRAAGRPIFGPTQAAARLESSKAFAKAFMRDHAIPTAASAVFRDFDAARDYLHALDGPVVVKASGLAAGKGVVVCDDAAEAETALRQMMVERVFGAAADEVLIEERLAGPELSLLAFCDGATVVPMVPARDHKRVFDGDRGPNTGGMGAYAPPPDADAALVARITDEALRPVVAGMAAAGAPYVGVLYAGLMLTDDGPKVLEFNCRFGDPETQAVLPLLASDLAEALLACVEGRLSADLVRFNAGACATVVMAAPGYPEAYPTGAPIHGLDEAAATGALLFHAGTARRNAQVVTNGGRVLAVSAIGPNVAAAAARVYEGVACIQFEGAHYRADIGQGSGGAGEQG
ncbi:phosphoribosylamine--glycine ligase [Promineifilum sp.]|uniref:phosphoribosylamine--glycine ligase n=1 Tax=Promineifilum sp. TaxID=2664178 RepID=UPI0035ADD83B